MAQGCPFEKCAHLWRQVARVKANRVDGAVQQVQVCHAAYGAHPEAGPHILEAPQQDGASMQVGARICDGWGAMQEA